MPTIKPKMNLVFSNERIKKMLDMALDDRCELNGTNRSWEVEKILRATLIPANEEISLYVENLYLGASTVKEEVSAALCDNAAGIYWRAKYDDMRPLVELAAQQSHGSILDMSNESIFHLRSAWGSVCELLGQAKREISSTRPMRNARASFCACLTGIKGASRQGGFSILFC